MKRVRKSPTEPQELADYRARFSRAPTPPTWNDFKTDPRRREPVKERLREDQRGLCAYCESVVAPGNELVEHFVPRSATRANELDWSNLFLCCAGGERLAPNDDYDSDTNSGRKPRLSCGHSKGSNPAPILNPLEIPAFPSLFRFHSETGAIEPDHQCCATVGLEVALVERTIHVVNIRAPRLNRARQALLDELLRQSEVDTEVPAFSQQRSLQIAAEQIPATGNLPEFFTCIRWFLGQEAERHLQAIGFNG
jgi:uncharacterized protein (TIGR02646 family)